MRLPFGLAIFGGVTTVVAKLFNMVKPHCALFGEKDFQQCVVIKRMVQDLNFDIDIVSLPTVREDDGLAMSSRNARLSAAERETSLCVSRALGGRPGVGLRRANFRGRYSSDRTADINPKRRGAGSSTPPCATRETLEEVGADIRSYLVGHRGLGRRGSAD